MKTKKIFNSVEDEEMLKMCIDAKKDYPGDCVETKKINIQIDKLLKKIEGRKKLKQQQERGATCT